MNKQYRLVWNKARRIVQVASELAHRPEGGTASSTRAGATSAHLTLSPKGLSFAAWIALGMVSVIAPVSAGQVTGLITADPNAPGNQRPTVLGSPGNAALINITTPSKAGVSINQYSAFQVDSTGAVLNNSRTNTQTTLAGTIGGNPWLANGSARVIVNQVNSSAPAALGGYIEVAGDKAQVVIASPSGIAVDGGGFLNASRVTLTTGTPVVSGGALEGYRVSGDGVIQVSGNGLDASRADYTDIIARAAVLDGTIYAQQLQLTLGANQVSVDQSQITPIAGTTQGGLGGAVPAFALDSSALGGMYANKIVLLANEHGVGVRNAGTIAASTGEVVVTTDGRLENSGRLQSQSDTTVLAAAGISNSGTISATNTLSITTPQDVDNSQSTLNAGRIAVDAASLRNQGGTIAQTGLQGMSLQAGALSNRNGGSIGTTRGGSPMAEAGDSGDGSSSPSGSTPPPSTESGASGGGNTAPSDGSNSGATPVAPLADGILHIAGLLDNDGGRISAAAGFDLTTANGLTNDGGQLGLRQLTVTGGDLSNRGGMLTIDGPAIIHGDNVLNDAGTLNVADALTINVQNLSNRGGTITHSDVDATTLSVANTWDNTDGTLASNAASLTVNSSLFINDGGHLNHAGTDGLTLTIGTWRGASGTVATAGATTVQAGSIDHRGASLSATQIHLTAANVNNEGGTIVASGDQANTLTVSGALDNSNDGTIASNADLAIQADTLGNVNGTIQHAGDGTLRIDASTLSGSGGAIQSNGALLLTGNTINLRGGTTSAQAITIDTGALTTAGGNLAALGSGLLQIHARGLLDNTDGRIGTNGGLQLVADTVTNTNGGIQTAGADATTVAITHAFTNANGQLATVGSTTLRAGSVDNTGGTIAAGSSDALTLTVDGLLTNDAGNLLGNSNLALTAGTLSNHGGTIQAQQAIDATVAGTLDNSQGGAIIANGNLDVQAATLLNANTLVTDPDAAPQGLHGQHVTLQVSSLDNTAGAIQASNGLAITGGALTNAGGVLDGQGDVTISGTSLDNSGHGQVIQHGDTGWLSINLTQALGNTAKGLIGAKGTASLHAGAIDNSGGTIYAGNDLTLASDGTLNNTNSGLLQTNGNLAVSAVTTLDNSAGHIDASGAATITAAAITNTDGQMLAGTTPGGLDTAITDAALTVTATGAIANQGGMIGNRGSDVILQAASVDNSNGGTVAARRDLTLDNVALFNNTGGTTYATRDLSFQNPNATLDNTGGQFGAGDTATLNLAAITNSSGGHMQANTLALTTPTLTNDGGTVKGALVQATFGTLNGIGQIYGAQELDAHVTGDYTHLAGQRLESDGVLSLIVDGTLTNQGTLQTPGELDLMAASLINTNGAVINASADDGSGVANIHVSGSVDNQQGATLEGDTLNVSATTLTNTGNIVGDVVTVDASALTNGRDLGTTQGGPAAMSAVDYGEGFIGASQALNLHVASLANLDAQLYSSGDLSIAADAAGNQAASILNRSGLIHAEGNLSLAAQQITNERRVFQTEVYHLTPAEQAQNTTTQTVAIYRDDDPDPLHHPPYVDSSQVLSASQIAALEAFCGTQGQPGKDGDQWCNGITYPGQSDPHNIYHNDLKANVTDTLVSVERLISASAAGELVSGGDMTLVGAVLNDKSTIAAGRNLTIVDPTSGASGIGSVQNIAWTPTGMVQETTAEQTGIEFVNFSGGRHWDLLGYQTWGTYQSSSTVSLAPGSAPSWVTYNAGPGLAGTITAGGTVTIIGGDVTNTVVGGGGGLTSPDPTKLVDPRHTELQNASTAQAGIAGGVGGASGSTVDHTHAPLPTTLPSNSTVQQHPEAHAPFLVTTAPRFARGASTSSNYLLQSLGYDPSNMQKRLGDGYYEQNLVMDQILQLTGRRSLNGGDPMAQYNALMDGAASEAARLGLQLGAPLTTAQIGALDCDVVWLVDQVVDGQHVLTPVVYLSKATADRMQHDGALIAGDVVNVASTGTVRNDGTISGTQGTWLSADTLINTGAVKSGGTLAIATRNDTINQGTLSAGAVSVQAGRDLLNTGSITTTQGGPGTGDMALVAGRDLTTQGGPATGIAPIQAGGNLAMVAGRDLTATASTIHAGGDAQLIAGNNLTIDATARTIRSGSPQNGQENLTYTTSSISAGGNLALVAGNNLTSNGAQLTAGNQLGLAAGNDLTLNAVTDRQSSTSQVHQGHTRTNTSTYDETVHGSTLSGANGVALTAGHDLAATAAIITSANGGVGLMAGHDLTLATAQENHSLTVDTKTTSSGVLSSSTKRTHDSVSNSYAIGTVLSGDSVTMAAGHDLTATAAQVVADHDIVMAAGNNLTLNTANDVHTKEHSVSKTKTGVMGAGVGVMVGQAKQSQDTTLTQTTPTGTVVGSLGGSVTISAGNNVHLTNATVLSDTGTTIVGKTVTIDAEMGTTDITQTYKQSSSGLTVGLGGAAVQAAQGAYAAVHRDGEVKDDRLTALYVAQAAYGVSDSVSALQKMGGANGISKNGTDGGINLQVGIGGSSASSKTVSHDETAYGSTIHSNGNVVIAATGGDLNVIGSQISGDNVGLMASNNINLLSQAENHTLKNTSKNASGGVGVQIGTDGIGFYAQASVGQGSAHGNGTTHATTSVDAANTLTLISGGDTNIIGAQARGNTVLADIGGNLNIRSEQDTDDYASKQQQASGKVVVGVGASGSGSYNQSKVDSHYASVTTVSGIGAGDGGYNIHVNGNTDLKGGVIASTADGSRNLLDTGSLTFSNIENKASYSASSISVGGGTGANGKVAAVGPSGLSAGIGVPQSDSSHNTTKAGIAQGTIVVRDGNADLSGLDRNATLDQQSLKPIFDLQKVQEQQEMGQVAGYVGMRAVGDISQYMANHATTDADKAAWSDGGANKVILHGLVGAATAALGGGDPLGGALGAGASEAASGAMQDYLRSQGIDPYSAEGKSLMQLGSAAIGSVGGGAGAATALAGDCFNRQLHQSEIDWIQSHAKDFASQQCGCDPSAEQISTATQQLAQQAARQTDVLWAAALPGDDSAARQYLAGAQGTFTNTLGNAQKLFTVEGNQYLQPMMYLPDASTNRGFYQNYVQPGAGNVNTGLQAMLAQAGLNAYLNQGETAWNAATGAITGIGNAFLHPVDTFNGAGQDLGNNTAYALNPGLVNDQLQAVYGQNVSGAAATLATLNTSLTLMGATGAGKGAAAAIEGAAKSAAVDALTAAVKAGWQGDAAGLEQFTRTVIGNTGSVNRLLSADAVNATMDSYNWSPAWQSGTMVADATIKPGTVVNMVVDEQTYRAIEKGDMSRAFGGWATFDDVPNQAYARNELAITSQMKPDASYVIQVEVTKPVDAQIGIVGDQPGATGGGNQLHFNLPPEQRVETFKVIGTSELH